MNLKTLWSGLTLALGILSAFPAQAAIRTKGFTITEIGTHRYDASLDPASKTEAQYIVDRLYAMGVRHINLSPRAVMRDPRGNFVELMTPAGELSWERDRYIRFINYVHGLGMTVGIRPIFFVVDGNGNIPYVENLVGGGYKVWWHGNIQPNDPAAWYASFRTYLETYMEIANAARAEEFTIGAELQSMTVGIGAEWPQHPQGFPRYLRELVSSARSKLYSGARIMYDINYADDEVITTAGVEYGGEIVEWRKALVDDVANGLPASERWQDLAAVWRGLDAIGLDMYRSLASATEVLPVTYPELVTRLRQSTDEFAMQMSDTLEAINNVTGVAKPMVLKEVGYRSVDRGFVDPFLYAGTGVYNAEHQAAAFEAVMSSFFMNPTLKGFDGIVFWDASVDMSRHGTADLGFSPIGKGVSEGVLLKYFSQP